MTAERRGGGHCRAHQMRAPTRTLPPLEVPVRCRPAALAGLELIAVECGAERAAGGSPFEAGICENAIKAFGFRLALDALRTWNDPGRNNRMAELGHRRGGANVVDPAIGAGADENPIDRDVGERHA